MNRIFSLLLALVVGGIAWGEEPADPPAAGDEIHNQLRALRDRMLKAYTERDLEALLADVEDNCVVTWQNGDRVLNKQEFRAFYDKMMTGENRIVKDVRSDFQVSGLSLIYGDDTAVAYGTCMDHFELMSGRNLDLESKWTATVVKAGDNWKVASFHISASIFDNPILKAASSWLLYAGILGGLVGLLVGIALTRLFRQRALAAPG